MPRVGPHRASADPEHAGPRRTTPVASAAAQSEWVSTQPGSWEVGEVRTPATPIGAGFEIAIVLLPSAGGFHDPCGGDLTRAWTTRNQRDKQWGSDLTITMERPDQLNAVNTQLHPELARIFLDANAIATRTWSS